jgi:hypothetical protein
MIQQFIFIIKIENYCFQTFFEVAKEERILFAGLVAIPTNHLQFDAGLFWSIL